MYETIISSLKTKKKKKENISMFSFCNNIILDIYREFDIDIVRFDLDEFAKLYSYKDWKRVEVGHVIPLLRNISIVTANSPKLLAVDLPFSEHYSDNNTYSLDKITGFYRESNADLIVLDFNAITSDFVDKLSKIKIPVIIKINSFTVSDDNNVLKDLHNRLIEMESMGAVTLVLHGFSPSFIKELKNNVSIPVLTHDKEKKADGFYACFSEVFGLYPSSDNRYLNIYELVHDSINDWINDE